MKYFAPATALLALITATTLADGPAGSVVGTLRLHEIDAPSLHAKRTIRVWLPPGYEAEPDRRYPVLYLHDAQNCFDRATSFVGKEWEVDETLTRLIAEKKVPPLIVVGIDNGRDERTAELTFSPDPRHGGGRGETYAAFLLDAVRPFVNRAYRTKPEPAATFLGGASLGATVSLEMARRHPDQFAGVIAMSPSLWWAGERLTNDIETDTGGLAGVRVWLDVGTREQADRPADAPENRAYVAQVRRLDGILTRRGVEHRLLVEDGGEHSETAWARRFPQAIEYLLTPARSPASSARTP